MKYLVDTHCHTISSGHAYSTISEMVEAASAKGMKIIAMTDHGPAMPGGPHLYHFGNMRVIPSYMKGVRILKGVEANIISYDGEIDMPEDYLKRLELVIASFHEICIEPGSVEENTRAVIGAMKNKYVDIIAHPGNPIFPINIEQVMDCAKETGVLIEINNSSFGMARRGSEGNCKKIAEYARDNKIQVVVGSDSHISLDVGRFDKVERLFEEIGMPDELVINTKPERLIEYLNQKGKKVLL